MSTVKDLILANSQLETLYRRSVSDLKIADTVIARLIRKNQELESRTTGNEESDGRPVRDVASAYSVEEKIVDRLIRKNRELESRTTGNTDCGGFSNEESDGRPVRDVASAYSVEDDDEYLPSVDLFGNVVEETPEWLHDTTSHWKWPSSAIKMEDLNRDDPLEAIGKAQDKYYENLSITTPPKLTRGKRLSANQFREVMIYP